MKVIHSWLKEYIGNDLPEAKTVADLLTFHAFEVEGVEEVKGEEVIEVDVLANRSSDCLSHRGIARELSSILGITLQNDLLTKEHSLPEGSKVVIDITDSSLCSRFTAAVITGVTIKESPDWLKKRLEALGQRSINNVVDATNYVMFALGQPTHAFDFDKLAKDEEGRVKISIRTGKVGESLTLLTGEEINSDETILHLVDGNNEALLDLAGIKGGKAAELTKESTNIVVTSGNFNYQSVRKTSQKLKVFTDASSRNQNQPSPQLAAYGLYETVALILGLAGGDCDGMVDVYPIVQQPTVTQVSLERTNALLGLSLTKDETRSLLKRVSSEVNDTAQGFSVVSPWERKDLVIEEDYIEEVGRLHGLKNITSVVPEPVQLSEISPVQYYSEKIRQCLIEGGFSEVITSSFQKKGKIELKSALASDKGCLRESLSKNVKDALERNFSHVDLLGISDVRIFEIGTVFEKTESGVSEHLSLAVGARVKGSGFSPKDEHILKEAQSVIEQALASSVSWTSIEPGVVEVNLSKLFTTLAVPESYDTFEKNIELTYKPFSSFPAISRDIALWVPEDTDAAQLAETLKKVAGSLCVRITQFDTFTKEGRTSYAFRLVFVSNERTLTDAEVNTQMNSVYDIAKTNGYEVR